MSILVLGVGLWYELLAQECKCAGIHVQINPKSNSICDEDLESDRTASQERASVSSARKRSSILHSLALFANAQVHARRARSRAHSRACARFQARTLARAPVQRARVARHEARSGGACLRCAMQGGAQPIASEKAARAASTMKHTTSHHALSHTHAAPD